MRTLFIVLVVGAVVVVSGAWAEDNALTEEQQQDGWILLFDGKTLDGWKTNDLKPSKTPVEDGCLNPHKCGGYMLIHEREWSNFVLAVDFKISKGCNSGIFFRVFPLTPPPKKSVAYNGLEMQILDSTEAGYHDTGAIYDLVKCAKNAMKPVGEWNSTVIFCRDNRISIVLNGERVTEMDLDEWTEPNKRPDGTDHKFATAWKDHPRHGYIGLQDHGHPVWFKNIKILPIGELSD